MFKREPKEVKVKVKPDAVETAETDEAVPTVSVPEVNEDGFNVTK